MVPVKLFHMILTSMLYKQLSAYKLLLCDVKSNSESADSKLGK